MNIAQGSPWMKAVLWLAGFYNLAWGAVTVLFPLTAFEWAGMEAPNYPELWQCVGMIVGVYGIGYVIAAADPYRHWPIVLVGLLGKLLGPIGFVQALFHGRLPLKFGLTLAANDVVWWVPFGAILYGAHRAHADRRRSAAPDVLYLALRRKTDQGESLAQMSEQAPLLVVFLRHAGCPFCREMLSDLRVQRAEIERAGVALAFVHMGTGEQGRELLAKYGLEDLPRISDPNQSLYRAFALPHGTIGALFGPQVWWRGIEAMILEKHGVGNVIGDSAQMPGVFLLYHGEVIRSYRHQSVSDRPNYAAMAQSLG